MKCIIQSVAVLLLSVFAFTALAQKSTPLQYWRAYDQRGVNVFEPSKEEAKEFEGLKVRIGGNFAQQYQGLDHSNDAEEVLFPGTDINRNELFALAPGFNLATANLYVDAQLADGIRVAVESYMSSRHHEEFWVKGGYIQVDKLPMFGNPDWFTDKVRVKIGHFQPNYGDQMFRRSDNGQAMYNPFVGNYIMDAFTTEIGGEAYLFPTNNLMLMAGMTSGLIAGSVEEGTRKPSVYAKAAYDKQFTEDFRFRLSGSIYTNPEAGRNTLYAGDRAGSRYYMVMEPAFAIPRGGNSPRPTGPGGNFTSGRWNPNFTENVTAISISPFLKYSGLEFFGTFESSSGYAGFENKDNKRSVTQVGAELLYRFLANEQLFVGARYNTLSGELAPNIEDATIDRLQISAGWYPIQQLLLKVEYVNQQYNDFPVTALQHEGEFNGFVLEAVVGF